MVFTKDPNEGIGFLVGFGMIRNTLASFKRYVMEPNVFLGYLTRGNACALNIPCHKTISL
jgi:hypothetical protein